MDNRALTDALEGIGLTQKEIDTYLVVLDSGETIVSEVADRAGVSKRHVYNIAVQLEQKNLVEMNDFVTPARLRAMPPEDVKRRLVTDANELYEMIETQYDRPELNLQRIEVLKSRSTLIKRIQQILRVAEEQVTIAIPPSLLPAVDEQLRAAVDRNVLVLLLLLDETADSVSKWDLEFEGVAHAVRVYRRDMAIQMAVDHTFGLIAPLGILFNGGNQTQSIAIGDPHLEPVVSAAFFGEQWNFSDEVHIEPADELPNTYLSFRLAVVQTALHLERGNELYAKVKAYPRNQGNDDRPPEHIEGKIVSVDQRMVEPEVHRPVASLTLETDSGTTTVGTRRCIYEDYEAIRTRLEYV